MFYIIDFQVYQKVARTAPWRLHTHYLDPKFCHISLPLFLPLSLLPSLPPSFRVNVYMKLYNIRTDFLLNNLRISCTCCNTSCLKTPAYIALNIEYSPISTTSLDKTVLTQERNSMLRGYYYLIFKTHSSFPNCPNNVYYCCFFSTKDHTWHLAVLCPQPPFICSNCRGCQVSLMTLTMLRNVVQLSYGMSLIWTCLIASPELDLGEIF